MTLKVLSLRAENYKRLKAVEIVPDPNANVVTITGRNAQGKTSVLDALYAAMAGGEASRAIQQPIRDGQDTAVVKLDLGDYVVTRRWTKNDSGTLTVESADGARYSSPQKLLDEVIGARAFDPLAFTRLSAKDQVAALTSLVELPFDPAELERERKGVFERRTEVNRDVQKLDAQLKGYPLPDPSLPVEEVSATDVLAEEDAARAHNARIDAAIEYLADLESDVHRARERVKDAERALILARDDLEAAGELLAEQRAKADGMPERIDTAAIRERLQSVEQTNARIRQEHHRKAVEAELHDRKNDAAALTIKLGEIEKRKQDALAAVEFPVPGLSFDESGVTYNGLPFSQASAAEQLRVSVALAMAANPTLRVLRILDGSLLDEDSMRIIAEMAAENDYQCWVEVVDSTGKVGVTIEDGLVVGGDAA